MVLLTFWELMRWPWYFLMQCGKITLIINLQMQMSEIRGEISHLRRWISAASNEYFPSEEWGNGIMFIPITGKLNGHRIMALRTKRRKVGPRLCFEKPSLRVATEESGPKVPRTGRQKVRNCGVAHLTGLLVRDTLSDSRQLNSFSSVMPDRSSWTYSWDESVNSCLLFLSPP